MEQTSAVIKIFTTRSGTLLIQWGLGALCLLSGYALMVAGALKGAKQHALMSLPAFEAIPLVVLGAIMVLSIVYRALCWFRIKVELFENGDFRVTDWMGRKRAVTAVCQAASRSSFTTLWAVLANSLAKNVCRQPSHARFPVLLQINRHDT